MFDTADKGDEILVFDPVKGPIRTPITRTSKDMVMAQPYGPSQRPKRFWRKDGHEPASSCYALPITPENAEKMRCHAMRNMIEKDLDDFIFRSKNDYQKLSDLYDAMQPHLEIC